MRGGIISQLIFPLGNGNIIPPHLMRRKCLIVSQTEIIQVRLFLNDFSTKFGITEMSFNNRRRRFFNKGLQRILRNVVFK